MSGRRLALAAPPFDLARAIDNLHQTIARTDAMVCAAERQFERLSCSSEDEDDDGVACRREHLAHLIGAAKESARVAVIASKQIALQVIKHRALNASGGVP